MARTQQSATSGLRAAPPRSARQDSLADPLADPLVGQQGQSEGVADDHVGPGLMGMMHSSFGAALQFKRSAGALSPSAERQTASDGLSGGGELPFRGEIEQSYGVDLGGVEVSTGSAASAACDTLGADGFTMGNQIAFASSSPSKELVAHEAAHVVQQSSGVQLSSKVGRVGDSYETQADAAAARVMSGQSAQDILPSAGGDLGGDLGGGGESVQFRRESTEDAGKTTTDNGKVLLWDNQTLYAEQGLIDQANQKLKSVGKDGSFITLASDGKSYDHEGHSLTRVVPQWVDHKDMGDHQGASDANEADVEDSNGITGEDSAKDNDGIATMALWADCGRSSGAITGSRKQNNSDRQVVYNKGGKEKTSYGKADKGMDKRANTSVGRMANGVYFDLMPDFIAKSSNDKYLTKGVHYTKSGGFFGLGAKRTPMPIADGVAAQKMYAEMTPEGQLAFDMAAGINAYANPEIGEAYAMATAYDMPGFKTEKGKNAWNFHWGGVIMKDGADNITLENYAVIAKGIDRFINRDWNFAVYGTMKAKGGAKDTFHSDHLGTGTHGSKATSIAVRTDQ